MNSLIAYTFSFGATLLAALAGGVASVQAGSFYGILSKPNWAPTSGVFGPVWTGLYILMAIAAGLALSSQSDKSRGLAIIFLTQLALNAIWSWTFFVWKSGIGSVMTIAALWLAIVWTVDRFWKVYPISGVLMLPYLAWVSFAAFLNFTIWRMNPGLL